MERQADRLNAIAKYLRIHNGTTIRELSEVLGVSHMTVRRDLDLLEQQGTVRLFHGGAIYNRSVESQDEEYSVGAAGARNLDKKRLIGRRAASLVEPGDVIIIDTGTTTEWIARALPVDIPLTILCYNLNVLREVSKMRNIELVLAGGNFHENTLMFESPEGIEIIRRTRATKAFLSAAGVHVSLGVTCLNTYESTTKIAVLRSSLQKILVADSSKLGQVQHAYFADIEDFNILVTDPGADPEQLDAIRRLGVEVMIA